MIVLTLLCQELFAACRSSVIGRKLGLQQPDVRATDAGSREWRQQQSAGQQSLTATSVDRVSN